MCTDMITEEELDEIINFYRKIGFKRDFKIKLEEGKWEVEYKEFLQTPIFDNFEKKIYKNSLNEEFIVYKFDQKDEGKLSTVNYIIKLSDMNFIGIIYNLYFNKYYLIKSDGDTIINKYRNCLLDEKTVIKTKEIVKMVCDDNDLLFKNQIKYLLNKKQKDNCYAIVNKQILNRTFNIT